jgi:crossover junction endodeoxyribonuclease RuvC
VIILGFDPGTRLTGWAVVDCAAGAEREIGHGVISTAGTLEHPDRLKAIYDAARAVAETHRADAVAVEMPVFSGNAQALLKLGRAQAAIVLAASHAGLPVAQYTPAEVKKAVVGNGAAAKEQVAYMVRTLLGLVDTPPPDAADALAVALCHARRSAAPSSGMAGARDWKSFVEANPGRVK